MRKHPDTGLEISEKFVFDPKAKFVVAPGTQATAEWIVGQFMRLTELEQDVAMHQRRADDFHRRALKAEGQLLRLAHLLRFADSLDKS